MYCIDEGDFDGRPTWHQTSVSYYKFALQLTSTDYLIIADYMFYPIMIDNIDPLKFDDAGHNIIQLTCNR